MRTDRRSVAVRSTRASATRAAAFGVAALLVAAALASCGGGDGVTTPTPASEMAVVTAPLPALVEEPAPFEVPTYESSGESVHPDVVAFPDGWRGWKYWLTMTPYAHSDSKVENPSIVVSADGDRFEVPQGLVNPVAPHAGAKGDYNSDPELLYDAANDRLVLFYRFVGNKSNTILVSTSRDGRSWSKEPKVFRVKGHTAVSPTVTPRSEALPPRMWYVNAGSKGCFSTATRVMTRASTDPDGRLVGATWAAPVATDLGQPGYSIWHLKVRYVPSHHEYWAVYAAYPPGASGCNTDDLFFARSADGVHWESFPEPLLRHEDRAWTAAAVYRSSFLYTPETDELQVWLSARGADGKWRLGKARFRYARLADALSDSVQTTRRAAGRFAARPLMAGEGAP